MQSTTGGRSHDATVPITSILIADANSSYRLPILQVDEAKVCTFANQLAAWVERGIGKRVRAGQTGQLAFVARPREGILDGSYLVFFMNRS